MGETLHDIDKIFQDGLEYHLEQPSKQTWENIEAELNKKTAVVYKKKYKQLKRYSVLLLLLLTGFIIYEMTGKQINNNQKNINDQASTIELNKEKANSSQGGSTKDNPQENIESNVNKQTTSSSNGPIKNEAAINNSHNNERTEINIDSKKTQKGIIQGIDQPGKINNTIVVVNKKSKRQGQIIIEKKAPIKQSPTTNEIVHSDSQITPNISSVQINNETATTISKPIPFQRMQSLEVENQIMNPEMEILKMLPEQNPLASTSKTLARSSNKKSANKNSFKSGFSVSFSAMPAATWNSIENDMPHHAGPNRIEDHDEIRKTENSNLAFSGNLKFNYNLTRHVSVQSGLNYISSSSSIDPKLIYADHDNSGSVRFRLDCSSGYSYMLPSNVQNPSAGDSLMVSNSRNSISYLGIPLLAGYKFSFGKFSVAAIGGGQANILLKGKTSAVFGKGTVNETTVSSTTQGLKSTYFSALTGITGELQLNKRISFNITPSGQFGLSSINKGASVKTRTNYLGVGAGLRINL